MIDILSAEVMIERDRSTVFDFIVDMENYPRFFPGVIEMKSMDGKAAGTPGKQYREVVEVPLLGKEIAFVEVKDCVPGERLRVQTDLAPTWPLFEYSCSALGPRITQFRWSCHAQNDSRYVRLVYAPLMRTIMSGRARKAMENLKRIVESL